MAKYHVICPICDAKLETKEGAIFVHETLQAHKAKEHKE